MQYFVALNLNRDLLEYFPGDTIDLPEAIAQDLLDSGVLSTEKVEAVEVDREPEPLKPTEALPVVGGAPDVSGEPSIDTPAAPTSSGPAKDVTPVLEDMTRDALNNHAVDKGIDPVAVATAPNKAAVIDLIKNVDPAVDPSANL